MTDLIISLGGSIICPDNIDINFLKKFREIILNYIKKDKRVVIVTGGGKICRLYQSAAEKITKIKPVDLDWIGIKATKFNAELVRSIFSDLAYEEVIDNPTEKISTKKKIIIGSGWQPDCSSDMDAVLLAENLKINTLINMSNIEYVYDKDPKKFKDAKKLKTLNWNEMLNIVGTEWKPGLNAPFDPKASIKAKELGLKVIILKGTDLNNFKNFLDNKEFKGTVIE